MAAQELPPDDPLSIKKKPADFARPILIVVFLVIIAVTLVICIAGAISLGIFAANSDVTANKLPGSWHGTFHIPNRQVNATYTFNKNGTLREESVDVFGRKNISGGRWRVQNGEVHIDWDGGGIEVATVHFVDNNTMDYRIIEHTDFVQIGVGATLKRK
jgi:hypothetical protein